MTTAASALTADLGPSTNGAATAHELFLLTDEQILDIEQPPDPTPVARTSPPLPAISAGRILSAQHDSSERAALNSDNGTRITEHDSAEPPPWLARQMNDPWSGDDARELWSGVQQARNEAGAYREVFAKPEDARAAADESRALKELYPGGIEQARTTSDRARTLEEIDAAFFGGAGKSREEISAGRAALAQRMLREDPAAFREMVFAGLRALEESAGTSPTDAQATKAPPPVGARHAVPAPPAAESSYLAEYRSFEKSANEDLERTVGNTIQRTIDQALPNLSRPNNALPVGARHAVPSSETLQARLQQAVRDDVESALKSDQQLGGQISQLLATRRFDENTRAQVVRLINDRAQQLVPAAARRVIQDWTQTAFAAHRGSGSNVVQGFSPAFEDDAAFAAHRSKASDDASGIKPPLQTPASFRTERSEVRNPSSRALSAKAAAANRAEHDAGLASRVTVRPNGRSVDYRRLSDEQILNL